MTSYPEHLSGFDYVGVHRYFLTFCTFERRRHLNKANPIRSGLVSSLREYPFWGSLTHSREELLEYVQRAA
jgi:hypothetical protein